MNESDAKVEHTDEELGLMVELDEDEYTISVRIGKLFRNWVAFMKVTKESRRTKIQCQEDFCFCVTQMLMKFEEQGLFGKVFWHSKEEHTFAIKIRKLFRDWVAFVTLSEDNDERSRTTAWWKDDFCSYIKYIFATFRKQGLLNYLLKPQ